MASGARELESLRRELEASAMERAQLQTKVDELLERAGEAERLRAELDRLKVISELILETRSFTYCRSQRYLLSVRVDLLFKIVRRYTIVR